MLPSGAAHLPTAPSDSFRRERVNRFEIPSLPHACRGIPRALRSWNASLLRSRLGFLLRSEDWRLQAVRGRSAHSRTPGGSCPGGRDSEGRLLLIGAPGTQRHSEGRAITNGVDEGESRVPPASRPRGRRRRGIHGAVCLFTLGASGPLGKRTDAAWGHHRRLGRRRARGPGHGRGCPSEPRHKGRCDDLLRAMAASRHRRRDRLECDRTGLAADALGPRARTSRRAAGCVPGANRTWRVGQATIRCQAVAAAV